jgi:hypothetical protein
VIAGQFSSWFGDTKDFELVETTVGEVGGRLHLRWRLRLQAERLGTGWFTVEQQAYADTDDGGRIARLDLLCTGYRPEGEGAVSSGSELPSVPLSAPLSHDREGFFLHVKKSSYTFEESS